FNDRSVIFTERTHSPVIDGVFGRFLFIDIDTESRFVRNGKVTVRDGRAAGEHFVYLLVEQLTFLNPEVTDSDIDMVVCLVSYRRRVAGTVPSCSHIKPLAQTGHFHRGGNTADLGNMATDEVKLLSNHIVPILVDVVE